MNGAVGERQPLDGQALATIHFAQLDATMRLIPLPELAVVLVIALVVLGLRTLREFSLLSFARRVGNVSQPRDGHLETERKRTQLIASCVLLMIISIPLILRVVPCRPMASMVSEPPRRNRIRRSGIQPTHLWDGLC